MAPQEKKKNAYGMKELGDIGEMYGKDVRGSTDYMMDEAKNLKNIADGMYRKKSSDINKRRFLGHDSMKDLQRLIKSYVPEGEKKNFYKMLGYLNSDANSALKDLKKYGEYTERLSKLITEYNRSNDPLSRSVGGPNAAIKIKQEMETVRMEMVKSIEEFKKYEEKVNSLSSELTRGMVNYARKKSKPEEDSHLGNAVLIVFSAMFGMSVLWALTQIQPENVTVGAFTAGGEASPIIISMLTGTVIFLTFFLVHHKLKR